MTDQFPAIRGNAPFKQTMLGGYDRFEVDEYVARLESRIEELEHQNSPDDAVQRALGQVGDEVAGILQRAHEAASQQTEAAQREAAELRTSARREADELRESARREAEERIQAARMEAEERIAAAHRDAAAITAQSKTRLQDLDVDADRVWGERERILGDLRYLAQQLLEVADAATERFPPDEPDTTDGFENEPDSTETFDVEGFLQGQSTDGGAPEDLDDTVILEPRREADLDPPDEETGGPHGGEGPPLAGY